MRYADEFTDEDRRTFAYETAKAAHVLGWGGTKADLWRLEAEGGLCRPVADPKRPFLLRAKQAAESPHLPGLAAALVQAAEAAGSDPTADAAILRRVDKRAGWNYGNPIAETVGETASQVREKVAAAAKAVSGNWYNVTDAAQIPATFLSSAFGTGPIVAEPVIRSLLSDPVKSASFEKVLNDAGIKPVSVAPRPRTNWAALAQSSSGGS